jgi:hypothetical protein
MKEAILNKVFDMFGDNLPSRMLYNGTNGTPVSVKGILSKFKKWGNFEKEYAAMCIAKRNEEALSKVVTKPAAKSKIVAKTATTKASLDV